MESSLDMQYRSIQKDRCLSTTLSLILGKHTSLSFSFTHTSIYPLYTTPPRLLGRFAALCSIQVLTFTFNCYIVCRHFSSYSVTNKQTNTQPNKQNMYLDFSQLFYTLYPTLPETFFMPLFIKSLTLPSPSCIPSILSICFILPKSYFLFSVCLSLIIVC